MVARAAAQQKQAHHQLHSSSRVTTSLLASRRPPTISPLLPISPFTTQDNTLALLSSPKASRAVQSAAADLLLRLMTGLQRSIALSHHPELSRSACSLQGSRPAASALPGAASQASYPAASQGAELAAGAGRGALLQELLTSVRGSDPTCPDSYPPLALPPAGLADTWRVLPGQERERVDVTAAVHSIVLQVRAQGMGGWWVRARCC